MQLTLDIKKKSGMSFSILYFTALGNYFFFMMDRVIILKVFLVAAYLSNENTLFISLENSSNLNKHFLVTKSENFYFCQQRNHI